MLKVIDVIVNRDYVIVSKYPNQP